MEFAAEYLDRLRTDSDSLNVLQEQHLLTVPFENLSIHLGEDIVLEDAPLVDKIVSRRRGGFCYELNGAFAALLSALGHEVAYLSARTPRENGWGPPHDHMALRVESWLVDVGFGSFSRFPLLLDSRTDQADPHGVFRITEQPDGDLVVTRDGKPAYRLDPKPWAFADFGPTCWWNRTSPESHFTRSLVCSRSTPDGRVTLSGRTLTTTEHGLRAERTFETDAEILAAYREIFGIELDSVPTVLDF
jgi:N-hydroxyarylamine O-acetyltransferase